jgi:predicted aspartyl protease
MDTLTLSIRWEQPIFRVITPVTGRQTKHSGLERKQLDVSAMWDTGSMGTCVSTKLARYLGLVPLKAIRLASLHGDSLVNECFMDIVLPDGIVVQNVKAMEIETWSDFDIIIGMNIIRLGDFSLCNDQGNTVMTFSLPSS